MGDVVLSDMAGDDNMGMGLIWLMMGRMTTYTKQSNRYDNTLGHLDETTSVNITWHC